MGLFNYYLNEGPGIYPNAPKKEGIALFFDVLFRKFFKMMKANILYFLFSIPCYILFLLFIAPMYSGIFISSEILRDGISSAAYDILFAGILFNFIGSGPLSAAYSYILRAFTKENYVWVFHDGIKIIKENFKQAVFVFVIDIAVLVVLAFAINFYKTRAGLLGAIAYFVMIALLIFYCLSHSFIYQIMITFKCSFKELWKDSFILTLLKLPMCLLFAALGVSLCYLIFGYFGLKGILFYVTLGMHFSKIPIEFYATLTAEKLIKTQAD